MELREDCGGMTKANEAILIVDDETPIRNLLKKILEADGYPCDTAVDAAEARIRLAKKEYALVLTDIKMPGESGVDFARFVRNRYPDIAIIVNTVIDNSDVAGEILGIGIYGYIVKPFEKIHILVNVANALARRRLEKEQAGYRNTLEKTVEERTCELTRVIRTLEEAKAVSEDLQSRFRGLVEGSTMGILIHRDMRPVFVNQAYLDLHGYSEAEFFALGNISPLAAPEEYDRLVSYFQARRSGDWAPLRYEYRGKRKNGSTIWLECRVMKVRWDDQDAVQFMVSDITERMRNETALRDHEAMLNTILESVMTGVVVVDAVSHRVVNVNAYAAGLIGRAKKDIIDRICHKSICSENTDGCPLIGRKIAVEKIETTLGNSAGRLIPVLKTFRDIDIKGRSHLICSFMDISERKKFELEIQQNHREMEALFSGISSILIGIDRDGTVTQWNKAAECILGHPADTIRGRCLGAAGVKWEWDRLEEGLLSCQKYGKTVSLDDLRFTGADGKDGFLGLRISVLADGAGGKTGVLIMGSDITEKKRLENQLAQAQKLESIGQLAAGIAHEINTPTQYVGDNTRFLKGAFGDLLKLLEPVRGLLAAVKDKPLPENPALKLEALIEDLDVAYLETEIPSAIEQTLEGVDRISTIVHSMKEFSHPGGEGKTAANINRALENTSIVARNEWKYVADLVMNLEPSLPAVLCLPGELNQVFLNLIINAAHAIAEANGAQGREKGKITLSTRTKEDCVEIRIEDTGCGIPVNIRHRIFDPFFTTKAVGKGTGQGLAIAHNVICEKHGGTLSFETREGAGTTFIIQLPVSDRSQACGEYEKTDLVCR